MADFRRHLSVASFEDLVREFIPRGFWAMSHTAGRVVVFAGGYQLVPAGCFFQEIVRECRMESIQELKNRTTNVLIVDAFPVWREGIKSVISSNENVEIVLETVDVASIRSAVTNGLVNFAIIDLEVPKGDGFEMLRLLRNLNSHLPVLVISALPEGIYGLRALKEGAAGYLTKDCTPEELTNAVEKIRTGRKYISDQLAQKLASHLEGGARSLPHERLTTREFEVMLMLGQGMSVKEVSDKLSLSYTTITTHKNKILSKMELCSLAQIVRYVAVEKLVK